MEVMAFSAALFGGLGFFFGWLLFGGGEDYRQKWFDALDASTRLSGENGRLKETLDLYDNQIWRLSKLARKRPDRKEPLESET